MATRYGRVKWGNGQPRQRTAPENWRKPRIWNRAASHYNSARPRVFCASLADWLDEEAPIEFLADLLCLIHDTDNLDWLLLTKRPQLFGERLDAAHAELLKRDADTELQRLMIHQWRAGISAPFNVWAGTSVENQEYADRRVPSLLDIPAKVHFLSCEPLLGPLDLRKWLRESESSIDYAQRVGYDAPHGAADRLNWIIVGGESGRGARIMKEEWALSLRDQCEEAGVAFHFKQWGGADKKAAGRELDGRTWDELPTPRVLQNS